MVMLWRVVCVVVLVIALMSSIMVGGCAQQPSPPEATSGAVVFGIVEDVSGPNAGSGVPYLAGFGDGVRYINEMKGGILGHPIKMVQGDWKGDQTLAVSVWERMLNSDKPVVVSSISAAASGVLPARATQDRVPITCSSSTVNQAFPKGDEYYFAATPTLIGRFMQLCSIWEQMWKDKKEARPPKVGVDVLEIGSPMVMQVKKITELECKRRNWPYNITSSPFKAVDVSTQVLSHKNFGTDFFWSFHSTFGGVVWVKEFDRQGFKPIAFGHQTWAEKEFADSLGDLAQGYSTYTYAVQWQETNVPGIKLLHDLNAKWHPEVKYWSAGYMVGFAYALVNAEAARIAIKKVGYEKLDGPAMKAGLESLNEFDTMGITCPITYTPNDHQGEHYGKYYTYEKTSEGMQLTPLRGFTGWLKVPDLPEEYRTDAYWK